MIKLVILTLFALNVVADAFSTGRIVGEGRPLSDAMGFIIPAAFFSLAFLLELVSINIQLKRRAEESKN